MEQYPEKLYRKLDDYPLILSVSCHLSETDFLRSQDFQCVDVCKGLIHAVSMSDLKS